MPSSRRFGKKENVLSLFQVDAGHGWRGGQRQSFFLARELRRRGYSCHLVVQPGSPLFDRARGAGLSVLPLRMRGELDVWGILRLALLMRRRKCQLIHTHDAHSTALGAAAARLAGVPLRVVSRRVDFPLQPNAFSRWKYTRGVDCIVAISEGVKKVLVKGGIDPKVIRVVPSGIDFSVYVEVQKSDYLRRELSFAPDDFLVGIVAHLADHKGHRYLIKASKILKDIAPKVKVIIVGEGPLRMELDRLAKGVRVEDIVFFLGFRKDVPQILSSLDLFVLSSYLEGMGSSLLDAMACRLPVVATRVGGIPEVVIQGETGLLVPPRRPESLARAIFKLYTDRELACRLGQKGFEVVHRKYSAESMAQKIIRIYERTAKKKGIQLKQQTPGV